LHQQSQSQTQSQAQALPPEHAIACGYVELSRFDILEPHQLVPRSLQTAQELLKRTQAWSVRTLAAAVESESQHSQQSSASASDVPSQLTSVALYGRVTAKSSVLTVKDTSFFFVEISSSADDHTRTSLSTAILFRGCPLFWRHLLRVHSSCLLTNLCKTYIFRVWKCGGVWVCGCVFCPSHCLCFVTLCQGKPNERCLMRNTPKFALLSLLFSLFAQLMFAPRPFQNGDPAAGRLPLLLREPAFFQHTDTSNSHADTLSATAQGCCSSRLTGLCGEAATKRHSDRRDCSRRCACAQPVVTEAVLPGLL
jgi:hypothetical protein